MSDDVIGRPRGYRATTRAGSFGAEADLYERARPGYPEELAETLCDRPGLRVLDIGCGTGKSSQPFISAGCALLGLEPDERMAAIAETNGLEVAVSNLENYDPGERRFNLIVAGQAWHWVDPEVGPRKAASLLDTGGRLVPFWNYRWPREDMLELLRPIYERLAPALLLNSPLLGTVDQEEELRRYARSIDDSGCFAPSAVLRFRWELHYSPQGWLDLMRTQSDHRLLESERFEEILDEAAKVVADRDDWIVDYETSAIVAEVRN